MAYRNIEDKKKYDRAYRIRNKAKCNRQSQEHRLALKQAALLHYGTSCCECGFSHIGALHIDHVNNDGAEQRAKLGSKSFSGYTFYKWLRDNNYPEGYQTLCANCNFIKQWNLTHSGE